MNAKEAPAFGQLLREYREAAGLSQERLAERTGLSSHGISDLERGARKTPRLETVRLLALGLGLEEPDQATLLAARRVTRNDSSPALGMSRRAFPIPPTPLIGREREIGAVADQLHREDMRLVTLTGPGGVGKTRLAMMVAHNHIDQFADGVIFIDLSPVRDSALVVPSIATALGVRDVGDQGLSQVVVTVLRDRRLLMVLDNFEQVVDAAPDIAALMAACPALKILATSRVVLHLAAERVVPIPPLQLPTAAIQLSLPKLAQLDAVAMFVDRAQSAAPSFTLTAENAETIAALVQQLDGLPLAIELAAARINVLPPRALLNRLQHRLDLLTDGPRDAPARQRTMRDTIAWSHDLLTDQEQRLFRRLGVFVGGFTLEAAQAVASEGNDVLAGVSRLVEASLVTPAQGVEDEPRFTMLETLREFAEEQLASQGEEATGRDRHARWVLALVRSTRTDSSSLNQILAIGPLEQEHANIRAALRWLDAAGQTESLADLVNALEHHWEWNKHEVEGLGWYQRVLGVEDLSPSLHLSLVGGAAFLAHKIDSPLAEDLVKDFVMQAEERGTLRQRADATFLMGMHAEDTGDYSRAEKHLPVAIDYAHRSGDMWLSLQYSYHLGVVALGRQALDRAMKLFDDVRSAAMGIDDPLIPAWCLVYQALIWCERGKPERAAELLRQHPDMNRTAYRQHEPLLRAVAGVVACQLGHFRRAARLLGSAAHDVPMRYPEKEFTERSAGIVRRSLGEFEFTREFEAGNRMRPSEVQDEIVQLLFGHGQQPVDGPVPTAHDLSPRELEVLRLIAVGKTDRHIADALHISRRTAERHARNVLGKLGAANRAEAAVLAVRDHLL